ncbi:hypothetical protein V5799_014612, partial [Amblyomma americanum]
GDSGGSPASQRSNPTEKKPPAKPQHAKTVQTVLKKGCWLTVGMNVFVCNELVISDGILLTSPYRAPWLSADVSSHHSILNDIVASGNQYIQV